MSSNSSTQKFNGANSKKEKRMDSSGEISTDLLNGDDKQQSFSYSVKRNEDCIHAKVILNPTTTPHVFHVGTTHKDSYYNFMIRYN